LILASASPRRREILSALRVPFEVVVPEVEELTDGVPEEVVVETARR
jgi:septum formation protein